MKFCIFVIVLVLSINSCIDEAKCGILDKNKRLKRTTEENPCDRHVPQLPNFTTSQRISQRECIKYVSEIWYQENQKKKDEDCEYLRLKKIGTGVFIRGHDAEPGEFPHMAALGWERKDGDWSFKCGCTVLNPNFVLTAGHCTYAARDNNIVSPTPKIVRLGVTDLNKIDYRKKPEDINIKNIIKHPNYNPPNKYNDIALIELEKTVKLSPVIQPACLWIDPDTSKIRTAISSAGWGVIDTVTKETSDILQTGELDIIDSVTCAQLYKNNYNRHWPELKDHQICAGKLAEGVDACQGDSGGPLQAILPVNLKRKMYYVLGVTSFGFGCGKINYPGIYTRVSSFVDWIESVAWANQK